MWNLVAIPFNFFSSSKESTRSHFIFWTFNHTEITRPEKCKKRCFENSQSASEAARLHSSNSHTYHPGKSRPRQVGLAWDRAEAGRSDTDWKLRLHMLAKPSFRGVFFLLWLLLRWLSKGKRSLSLPRCLENRCMAGCLNLGLFHPSGHTDTSPRCPGQWWPSRDLFCLTQHIPAVPWPRLPVAALLGSCWQAPGSILPPVQARGAEPAFLLPSLLSERLVLQPCSCSCTIVQHCCCTLKRFTDSSVFSSRSCFLV